MEKENDVIDIMLNVRKAKSFLNNFMTRQQKFLSRFNATNVIGSSESQDNEEEVPSDFDDTIAENLQSHNGFTAILTLAKIAKILHPYTE